MSFSFFHKLVITIHDINITINIKTINIDLKNAQIQKWKKISETNIISGIIARFAVTFGNDIGLVLSYYVTRGRIFGDDINCSGLGRFRHYNSHSIGANPTWVKWPTRVLFQIESVRNRILYWNCALEVGLKPGLSKFMKFDTSLYRRKHLQQIELNQK